MRSSGGQRARWKAAGPQYRNSNYIIGYTSCISYIINKIQSYSTTRSIFSPSAIVWFSNYHTQTHKQSNSCGHHGNSKQTNQNAVTHASFKNSYYWHSFNASARIYYHALCKQAVWRFFFSQTCSL